MNVLIACEESQEICKQFRKLGHNAFSCDIIECSGGHPEWHFQQDCLEVIKNKGGQLQSGVDYFLPDGERWDLMVAHPPCTYLAVSGARWMYHPDDKDLPIEQRRPHPKHPNRKQLQEEGAEFFMKLINADIEKIAVENPVGVMSSRYKKPTQIIEPYQFGHPHTKKTCLWLKNLPPLKPTKIVEKGEVVVFSSGKTMTKWMADAFKLSKEERQKVRSKTFRGIAEAIAEQWGGKIN